MTNDRPPRRVAIVVGAAGELGGATALKLADRGMTVVAVDRNEPGLEGLPEVHHPAGDRRHRPKRRGSDD